MNKRQNTFGFAPVETLLVVVIIALVVFVGWYVLHAKHNANTSLDNAKQTSASQSATTKKTSSAGSTNGTDNASLQTDLNSIDKSQNTAGSDAATANGGLNDNSQQIAVPTN